MSKYILNEIYYTTFEGNIILLTVLLETLDIVQCKLLKVENTVIQKLKILFQMKIKSYYNIKTMEKMKSDSEWKQNEV